MIRAVLDANVIVSAVLTPHRAPFLVLEALRDERFILIVSAPILDEWARVLWYPKIRKLHGLSQKQLRGFLDDLAHLAIPTEGKLELPGITRDHSDDQYVACAVEGNAGYIVSGDDDLLAVSEVQGIEIVTPRAFLEVLDVPAHFK